MADEKLKFDNETPTPFEEALERAGNGVYNRALASVCAFILLAIGADLFGFSLVIAAACDLNVNVTEKGILTSLPFIGILCASYFWGYISDTRGRRYTLLLSLTVSFVLSSLSSLSPNWIVLAIIKFVSVSFSCAANSATYTIVGESCVQRVRSKYVLLMTCLLLLSPATAGFLTYPTLKLDFAAPISFLGIVFRPWRLLCIVLAIPSGFGALAIYFFYESPKFLANIGRNDEALEVLRNVYSINNKSPKEEFKVYSLKLAENFGIHKNRSLIRNMYEQSAPLFRPPMLKRTIQLFYIVAVVYITNNSFLMWLPYIMKLLREAMDSNAETAGNLCQLISSPNKIPVVAHVLPLNVTGISGTEHPTYCHNTVEDNTIITLITSQAIYSLLNFCISLLPNRRKALLLSILTLSASGGILLNLTPEPFSSVALFIVFTSTCLGMGILASYFVDLYPTSYRGMVACLSIMVGRSSTFVGINVVGKVLFTHCQATFYSWSFLVFTSAIAAYFLPPDKGPRQEMVASEKEVAPLIMSSDKRKCDIRVHPA